VPITDSQFRKGSAESTIERQILRFLAANPDLAYTAHEVAEGLELMRGLNVWADFATLQEVTGTLGDLVESKKVQAKIVLRERYYRAARK